MQWKKHLNNHERSINHMPKKGENIRKRKDGRWEGRYKKGIKENGKILYSSVYGKSYREVKEKIQIALSAPTVITPNQTEIDIKKQVPSEMTLAELLIQWQENNEIRLKGGTRTRYSNLINAQIIPCIGYMKVSEITTASINAFLNDRLQRGRLDGKGGLSGSCVRSISLVISSALKYAASEEICAPLKNKISKPSIVKSELAILSLNDQRLLEQKIINDLSPTSVGILITLYTGLRIGEVCALMWSDIDFSTCTLSVRHTVSRVKTQSGNSKTVLILDEPKTISSKRIIPIPSPLLAILCEYRTRSKSAYDYSLQDIQRLCVFACADTGFSCCF